MTAEELFESVGFVKEYYVQMSEFYKDNFESERDMNSFFVKVFRNDDKDKTPRRMMNQIQHLVSISNDLYQDLFGIAVCVIRYEKAGFL